MSLSNVVGRYPEFLSSSDAQVTDGKNSDNANELLSLAVAAKERVSARYTIDLLFENPALAELRRTICEDEKAHLAWLREKLARVKMTKSDSPGRVESYLAAEQVLYVLHHGTAALLVKMRTL